MTRLDVRRVVLGKRDAPERECEDAVGVAGDVRAFAVADGATEGLDSRRWARRLVRAWTAPTSRGASVAELAECARRRGDRLRGRWTGRPLPWYLEEKAAAGAFAAFVGVELDDDLAGWSATAIGDCCFFVEEEGRIASSFPATSSAEFGYRPTLLPSNHGRFADFEPFVRTTRGAWNESARLVLMSDAVSAWWFDEHARGGALVREVHAALDDDDADAVLRIVAAERAARRMRDDDVAILRVERRGR